MRVKLKVCGVARIDDARAVADVGVDFIGVITDPVSPRSVNREFVEEVKRAVSTPVVEVIVTFHVSACATSKADYVQIHRVLTDEELEILTTFGKKTILYVPASRSALPYLLKAQMYTDLILFDSPKKGLRSDPLELKLLLDYHPDAGIGGGITVENVYDYLVLEPGWIDVSSGVEVYPGKKDIEKVRRLREVVTTWKRRV
uniref:N-(5'-phosphoribosyl)anthranilate isomerase n=1 Tax=Fervidicoccus fontis TaxID=683846 RepID=A0A7J3ZJS1_9CREN